MMKHIPTLAAGLALTGSVFAMGLPQMPGHYIVGFELGYLRPNVEGLNNIGYVGTSNGVRSGVNSASRDEYHTIGLDYDFAYKGIIGYQFANSRDQVVMTYQYLREKDSDHREVFRFDNPSDQRFDNFIGFGNIFHYLGVTTRELMQDGGIPFRLNVQGQNGSARATLKSEYHSVNFLGRTTFDFGQYVSLQPYVGGQFAYNENDLHATAALNNIDLSDTSTPGRTFREVVHFTNDFWGVGPKAGATVAFHVVNGLDILASASGAVLFGQTDADYQSCLTEVAGDLTPLRINIQRFKLNDRKAIRVIPVLGGRLALRYTYHIGGALDSISISGGIKGEKYFDAVDNSPLIKQANAPTPTSAQGEQQYYNEQHSHYTDFMVAGPFGNITLVF